MRIVISGEIDFPAANRQAAIEGAQALIELALAEQGCRHYAWTYDPYDAGRVHVFEEWDSAEDLQAHFDAEAYHGMLAHLASFTILGAETRKYRVDASEPVYGPDGKPTPEFLTA